MIPVLPPTPELALIEYVQEACDAVAEVRVEQVGLSPSIQLGENGVRWSGDPCKPSPTLRLIDEESDSSWFVKPRLTVLVHASVTNDDVRAGDTVHLVDGIVPIERVRGGRVPEGTWQAKTPLRKGAAVSLAHVQRVPDAVRGAAIIVSVRRDNIHLTAEGELLGDAHIGDTVQTLNHATHATLTGVLVSPHLVEIQ